MIWISNVNFPSVGISVAGAAAERARAQEIKRNGAAARQQQKK